MTQLGTSRLSARFIGLLLPSFVIAAAIGLSVLAMAFQRSERNELTTRIGNISARAAVAIGRLGQSAPRSQAEAVLGLLLADPAISCAEIIEPAKGVIASVPIGPGCSIGQADNTIRLKVRQPRDAVLAVGYSLKELNQAGGALSGFSLMALLIGAAVTAATSWLSFRLVVGKPVHKLLEAIQTTERTGNLAKIADLPSDELGVVMHAFNDMQDRLAEEQAQNLAAIKHLGHLYNETPALMFTLADDGTIGNVSGHLLDFAGYERDEIIGWPLDQLVGPDEADQRDQPLAETLITEQSTRDMPLVLRSKGGAIHNVLLSSIAHAGLSGKAHLCVMSDVTGLKAAQTELRQQAIADHLTGLPNRKGLFQHLAKLPRGSDTALLFIDLDKFKTVNDTLGHEAGDTLLRMAAARINNCVQATDLLARLGGDEFAVVMHDVRSIDQVEEVAAHITRTLAVPFQIGAAQASIGASIGIASLTAEDASGEEALRLADLAMYKSKQSGRNCVSVYSPELSNVVMARDRVTKKIREALRNDRLRLFLQPIMDLETLKPAGAEALLRLQCPEDGLLPPGDLIRIAEETGYMTHLGKWVVNEGMRLAASPDGPLHQAIGYVSINLSPTQLEPSECADMLRRLSDNPRLASRTVFEITETAFLKNEDTISALLGDIRQTGARIALDDFGTGYSTLGHIQRFEVDILKIDRTFVRSLTGDGLEAKRSRALVRATAILAQDLGIDVVAEGIEDVATLESLKTLAIGLGQGYLFAPPLPQAAFDQWLASFSGTRIENRHAKAS